MRRSKTTVCNSQRRSKMDLLNDSFHNPSRRDSTSNLNASWNLPTSSSSPGGVLGRRGGLLKTTRTGKRSLHESFRGLSGGDVCPSPRKNSLFRNNHTEDDINSLLGLLHTNEFAGKVDLEHHSRFMNEPKLTPSSPAKGSSSSRKKIMMRSSFQSDTHLLSLKDANRNASMVPAWAQ